MKTKKKKKRARDDEEGEGGRGGGDGDDGEAAADTIAPVKRVRTRSMDAAEGAAAAAEEVGTGTVACEEGCVFVCVWLIEGAAVDGACREKRSIGSFKSGSTVNTFVYFWCILHLAVIHENMYIISHLWARRVGVLHTTSLADSDVKPQQTVPHSADSPSDLVHVVMPRPRSFVFFQVPRIASHIWLAVFASAGVVPPFLCRSSRLRLCNNSFT